MPTQRSTRKRITDLLDRGAIDSTEGSELLDHERRAWAGIQGVSAQLDLSVQELLNHKVQFVICNAKQHRFPDSNVMVGRFERQLFVEVQFCERCTTRRERFRDRGTYRILPIPYRYDRPEGYSLRGHGRELTRRDLDLVMVYQGIIEAVAGLEARASRKVTPIRGRKTARAS